MFTSSSADMLEGRKLKERKISGQSEVKRTIIDNRNRLTTPNQSTSRSPSSIGPSKVNTTTRIPRKVDSTSALPLVSSSSSSHPHHQPLSVPTPSSTTASPSISFPSNPNTKSTLELTPEIHFLIREHAKTLEVINKITNRLDQLEHKIEDICRKVKHIDRYNTEKGKGLNKKGESTSRSGLTPNDLSDDSGVEYDRTTNGTGQDDDELLSLLNQITKFSDSINTTLTQPNLTNPTVTRPDPYLHHHHLSPPRHPPPPPPPLSPSARKNPFLSMDYSRSAQYPEPSSSQSFSELLFDSNVDHFLANLDFVADPVRPTDFYYPRSMPISPLAPPTFQHPMQTQHQLIKSHPIPVTRLLAERFIHPHDQPDQQ